MFLALLLALLDLVVVVAAAVFEAGTSLSVLGVVAVDHATVFDYAVADIEAVIAADVPFVEVRKVHWPSDEEAIQKV